ncbi:alpha/beta fold hydrolase [Streptomyces sp. RerS4]|uniref:alpha/beta hydrolase n=1 Tax=Streptomyces sp. RerS4 TaxID=2942449 RepID=UPI00201BDD59|nr:alpha/beta fold hydrolase [Streptomyces sp. RerS4]UQX03426.1 alpha/beta fold hydrolase [Streptomyces sp. RerS4]
MSRRAHPSPTAAEPAASGSVRRIVLDAAGTPVSGLLAEPEHGAPRAVVVALHGGGMTAGYFHSPAANGLSLLTLGASLGVTVVALDRPGYGASAPTHPDGQTLAEQTRTLHLALDDFAARYDTGRGMLLLAHSYGGKLALTTAAEDVRGRVLGLDISGCARDYSVAPEAVLDDSGRLRWKRSWGPLRLYPTGTFRYSGDLVTPMPVREREELPRWPDRFPAIAARVRVPVRLTFAEHEAIWRHGEEDVAELRSLLASPRVLVERQNAAGHNISLGWTARAYHLRALAFLEECLAGHEAAVAPC